MPETSIDKYGDTSHGKYEIRSSKNLAVSAPAGYFLFSKQMNECKLCGRVLRRPDA
jgi:hypothetical protein